MKDKPSDNYSALLTKHGKMLSAYIKKARFVAFSRGFSFLLLIAVPVYFWSPVFIYNFIILLFLLILFLVLVKWNINLNRKIDYIKELIQINQFEIDAFHGDYSSFYAGEEFIDPTHPYTYDLDIFGEGSIYQMINRSCTMGGAEKLANKLKGENLLFHEIIDKQKSILELSKLIEWRQSFQAYGNLVLRVSDNSGLSAKESTRQSLNIEKGFYQEMAQWFSAPYHFLHNRKIRFILLIIPAISLILFGLTVLGFLSVLGFVFYGLFLLSITGLNLKQLNRLHGQTGHKAQVLKKYTALLHLIENQQFHSDYIQRQKTLSGIAEGHASKSLKRLQALSGAFDNRLNILFSVLANAFFLYDLQIAFRLETWKSANSGSVLKWLKVIYEFDALSGLANFAYNNPEYATPEIINEDFLVEMEQGGHPLIQQSKRVNNDTKILGAGRFLVITGANMAGKSTFLRTLGVNIVLAMTGSVVCAAKFRVKPIALHTSIRTTDSVQKSESYFFAELKRLKSIIDRLQQGEPLFIILDEMLRGTNSKDKHLGSQALIEQLIRLKATGLIATHDIALGDLALKYPEYVRNCRFEVEIQNNELVFDYTLKDGISQNLNATFLMKKMGITL
jgi:DNA mismatch repair ATPase MutS